jgi:hypothetical protein
MNIFDLATQYLTLEDTKTSIIKIKEEEKCLARLWDKGEYGNTRCSKSKINDCLCMKHYNCSLRMGGKWWLGLITEERPENPEHPISGVHKWSKDINGNGYIIEENKNEKIEDKKIIQKEKRKRGRPKGSKNKK